MEQRSTTNEPGAGQYEPKIVAFFCNWCTYTAADLAGVGRMRHAPNARVIRVMCSGRVDPQFVLDAFAKGADGVLIGGCHPGDCHYVEGNYKTLRRVAFLQRLLEELGIEKDRLRLEWISASEGDRVRTAVNAMTDRLRELGPLDLARRNALLDREVAVHHEHPDMALHPAAQGQDKEVAAHA